MNKEKYELAAKIGWSFENYFYSNTFNLERVGYYRALIMLDGEELKEPNSLYKFYGNSEYSLKALENSYLYFSNPRNFNDPFDCLTNREEYILKGGKGIVNHRDRIGVCCFSLTNENPLMWGHYTNNYNGFCIKYDNQKLLKRDEVDIKSHVSYLKNYEPANSKLQERALEIESLDIPNSDKEFIKKILMMLFEYCWKFYDWNYEKEYRAISFNSNDFKRELKCDKEDIKEVYIGNQLKKNDPKFYESLTTILRNEYSHAKVFQVKPHPLVVKLEFKEIL